MSGKGYIEENVLNTGGTILSNGHMINSGLTFFS